MKACIVTGAASGIGLATTCVPLDRGWRVAALMLDETTRSFVTGHVLHLDGGLMAAGLT